ncbi:glycosyltransferase family 2 protein [Parabacteroides sp.]
MTNISIACCTYNGSRYLSEQLESLLSQTILPDEIVVCDDCSTDDTREIISSYVRNFPRVKWVFVCNEYRKGVRLNFEQAIRLASGKYIATCDQDDIWKENKLAVLLDRIERTGCALVHSDAELIDSKGHMMNPSASLYYNLGWERNLSDYILGENNVIGCTLMFRSELKKFLFPFPAYYYYHDQWLAIWAYHNGGISFVDEKLVGYRQHTDNVVASFAGGGKRKRLTYSYFLDKAKDLYLVIKNGRGICLSINDTARLVRQFVGDMTGFGYLKYRLRQKN